MNDYQEALDYINKSVCTLLALRGIQDEQVIKNLHILQEVIDKANKYDKLLSILEEYNVDLSNIREILVAGNMAQDWKDKYDKKETPKKVIHECMQHPTIDCDQLFDYYGCPNCNINLDHKSDYCEHCGQALDWED